MKILEYFFLALTILIPTFFIVLGVLKINKFKKNKKFRKRIISYFLISLILNGAIYGGLKMYNKIDAKKEIQTPKENDFVDESTSENKEEDTPKEGTYTSKGFAIETIDGVTYIDGYLLVNKTYPLPADYVPAGTHTSVTSENCATCIVEDAYEAYQNMREDASTEGLNLWIASGYRSYKYQDALYSSYVKRNGQTAADTYSARPGHSEHQSGYAFDLNSVSDAFANTKEGKWVADNAYKYGFIIRYPEGKDDETGYKYESWHLRYVGTELAVKLYNGGDWITMESYFGITSEYPE